MREHAALDDPDGGPSFDSYTKEGSLREPQEAHPAAENESPPTASIREAVAPGPLAAAPSPAVAVPKDTSSADSEASGRDERESESPGPSDTIGDSSDENTTDDDRNAKRRKIARFSVKRYIKGLDPRLPLVDISSDALRQGAQCVKTAIVRYFDGLIARMQHPQI